VVRIACLALALLGLHLASCGRINPPEEGDGGREGYLRACASCHGVQGRGDGPVASALRGPPPDLTTLSSRYGGAFPRDVVVAVVTGEREVPAHGTRLMPVWNERFGSSSGAAAVAALYTRRRLESLADYVESLQRAP
jgi:mono/diheme cytochrome c family protein